MPDRTNEIPYRTLDRTGERVSVVGLGGYHLGKQSDPNESIRIIRTGIDEGINFLDNCWDYNGGESEVRMGKALRDGYRQKVLLMTKIDGRSETAAAARTFRPMDASQVAALLSKTTKAAESASSNYRRQRITLTELSPTRSGLARNRTTSATKSRWGSKR